MRRISGFIIPALACQLLLAVGVLTTELRAQNTGSGPGASVASNAVSEPAAAAAVAAPEIAIIRARTQEKVGHIYHLRGDSEIDYKQLVLRSDEADYNDDTGEVDVRGHVTLDGGPYDEHIAATHGTYNVQSETGKFYDVKGTTGYRFHGKHIVLTSSTPFGFTGKEVDKVGEDHYVIHHGTITSCEMPHPNWHFAARRIDVHMGDKAYLYNSAFDVKSVPIFYFPYTWHPAEKLPRESGFLLPSFGTSSRKGFMLGDSFYWAINRSMDATLGAELWSSRGWAQHGEFRARPSEDAFVESTYFGVLDRGAPNRVDESGEDIYVTATGKLPWEVRGVLSGEYLSSYAFRQTWAETFAQAINSEVNSAAFLSKNQNAYSFNLIAQRYQNFESAQRGDSIIIQRVPSFDASSVEQSLGDSRFFWSYNTSLGGLSRSEPGFRTAGVTGRFDLQPRLSYSFESHGWTFRPELAPRETYYSKQQLPSELPLTTGVSPSAIVASRDINRRALEAGFEFRPPALHRVFSKPVKGRRLKHVIEPRVQYTYVQGVNNFAQIIRFDDRDIVSDTNQVEFGVVNRLYSKRLLAHCANEKVSAEELAHEKNAPLKDCASETPSEIVTWQLGQEVYFNRDFGGALVPGQRNVLQSTVDFTGVSFLTDPRRLSPVISRLRINPHWGESLSWDLDYDSKKGRISSSSTFLDYRTGDWFFDAGHTYLVTPGEVLAANTSVVVPSVFNQYRLGLGYGNGAKRGLTAATSVGFDVRTDFLQYSAIQSTYNWNCCGFTVEYRRIALGPLRNENQFRFAFNLANIGTFGNLKRTERIY